MAWEINRPDKRKFFVDEIDGPVFADLPPGLSIVQIETGFRLTTPEGIEYYDDEGKLTSIEKPGGVVETLAYDAVNKLTSVTDHLGRQLQFSYDQNGELSKVTDPAGQEITYSYTGDLLSSVTYPDGSSRVYHYEDSRFPNALTGITDENGDRFATWAYNDAGKAISSEHADGADRVDLDYVDENTTVVTDALGTTRTYNFVTLDDSSKKLGSITGDNCGSCSYASSYTYDDKGFIASETDFNGNITSYSRDNSGRVLSRSEAVGTPQQRSTTFEWHPDWQLPTKITEAGRITDLVYNDQGNLLSRTVTDSDTAESRTTTYTYTALGLLETIDGARTDVTDFTSYTYDAQGNLISVTNALNQVTQIPAHDGHGNPLRIVDANGVATLLTYDPRQRLTSRSVDGAVTQFDYDGVGQLTSVTLPDGASLTYSYDAAHRLTGIEDSLGNRIVYTLDAMGNRTKVEVFDDANMLKRTQSQVFDALSQLKEVHGANGQLTEYQYDANGNRISTTQASIYSTLTQFDALDRLIKVTDADNGETSYTYDALDRLTSVTDPEGLATHYSYNAFGDLISQTSPDTGTSSYSYDSAGNRVTQTDARGITVAYSYDALNRLSLADYPGTIEDVSYLYDGSNYSNGEPYGVGRLTGFEDQPGQARLFYDARGNLIRDERGISGQTYTTSYSYDRASNLTSMTYPSGRQLDFNIDEAGRINAVDTDEGPVASSVNYLPFGPLTSMTLGNGINVTRSYDQDYRLTGLIDGAIRNKSYSYDPRNQITQLEDLLDLSKAQNFEYDALGRLTQAQGVYGQIGYDYDAIGNRQSKTVDGLTDSYSYDTASHHLLQAGNTTISYDAAGNTVSKGNQQFTYNQVGRMSEATGAASYLYNALGQRVSKTTNDALNNPQSTLFVYDQQGQMIAEMGEEGAVVREYLYLNNQPIAMLATPKGVLDDTLNQTPILGPILGGILGNILKPLLSPSNLTPAPGLYYLHPDHLGTPRMATDANGNIAWSVDYRPFGEVEVIEDTISVPLRFPGQYADAETGLSYNYFRDYDPETGRYIQSDPIGLQGGINTYGYALQNPLRYTDPLGLWSLNIGAYLGIGGGLNVAYSNGTLEITGEFGVGYAASFNIDPNGEVSRDAKSCGSGHIARTNLINLDAGIGVGLTEAGINTGITSANMLTSSEVDPDVYFNPYMGGPLSGQDFHKIGFGIGVTVMTVEVGSYIQTGK